MDDQIREEISFDDFDEMVNPRPDENQFDDIVEAAITRRGLLGGVLAFGGVTMLGSVSTEALARAGSRLAFAHVAANTEDTVTVPEGYKWDIVAKWGQPLWSGVPDLDPETRGTGATQERSYGDNTDGMALFQLNERNLLVANNEYTNRGIIHGNRESGVAETEDDVRKSKAAHGVSITEVEEAGGAWHVVKDSPFNRRITADTPMEITGPARGHDLLKTAADPDGVLCLGTWNNCGNGRTPWDTYLACEENFNGYYSSSDPDIEITPAQKRYGVGPKDWGYNWAMGDERFDIAKHPNESNRNGYVVEIDPANPGSTPRKLTALGRIKHENAEVVVNGDGRIVVYMGDDERGEYLYKFVSDGVYAVGGDTDHLLEEGQLYVAKFNDDLTGEWLALTPETTGMADKADICIHTRMAASAVGGTTMDRPEWVAANPVRAEVCCALTNNKNRGVKPNAGGDDTSVNGPNPREANKYGQIVRWRPDGDDHTADGFTWDLFVMAGNPAVHEGAQAGSANIEAGNMFNSPDGLFFDPNGLLWIQTDGNYSNEKDFAGMGNNQMLVGDPETGEIRRFMVGPNECEVTGAAFTADKRTLFVGIQHPGEKGNSNFPDGPGMPPRSCVIAISREDGGIIA